MDQFHCQHKAGSGERAYDPQHDGHIPLLCLRYYRRTFHSLPGHCQRTACGGGGYGLLVAQHEPSPMELCGTAWGGGNSHNIHRRRSRFQDCPGDALSRFPLAPRLSGSGRKRSCAPDGGDHTHADRCGNAGSLCVTFRNSGKMEIHYRGGNRDHLLRLPVCPGEKPGRTAMTRIAKVIVSDAQIDAVLKRARKSKADERRVKRAVYDKKKDRISLLLTTGVTVLIPRKYLQGLEKAKPS